MPLTINTNMAASRASYFLSKNNDALQKSLDRLSSGRKITQPSDDAGGLAVSMKMKGEIDNLTGAANNVSNALSFLQVQDGILDSVAQIVSRMGELKGLTQDVLKSPSDIATYDSEFQDLQQQLHDLSVSTFNSVTMFANDPAAGNGFDTGGSLNKSSSNLNVSGAGGVQTEISKSLLLSALTVDVVYTAGVFTSTNSSTTTWSDAATVVDDSAGTPTSGVAYLAVDTAGNVTNLGNLHAGVFTKALENLASLRAQNGGEASRLQFEQENIATQAANMEAALGRILDVDIAAETTNLAKQQILVQASASMVAQANSANQVALMLLQ
jgi:flagellin